MAMKKLIFALGILTTVFALSVTAQSYSASQANTERTTFKVSNLSCGSCLATIEGELRKYEGMVDMSADLRQGLVTIGHTEEFGAEEIAKAITLAGYPARTVTENEVAALAKTAPNASYGSGCGSRGCGTGGCGSAPAPN